MRCILRKETDPAFNLAAEEFVTRNLQEDVFMLWQNDPAVIIGKHQNAFAEINHEFVASRGIKVIRRISGGGAVYHDHGNLNFSFISHGEVNHLVDFPKYTLPIVQSLGNLGLKVAVGARNNLFINGYKISGNAEHVYKNKVLHHGTLLFNSELDVLEKAIKPPLIKYEDKAVKSVRSRVANILDFLHKQMTIEEFTRHIKNDVTRSIPGAYLHNFTKQELTEINNLKINKYDTWEWNYGYSPRFTFPTVISSADSHVPVVIEVKEGIIHNIITEEVIPQSIQVLSAFKDLIGTQLRQSAIEDKLKHLITPEQLKLLIHSLFAGGTAEHLQNANV